MLQIPKEIDTQDSVNIHLDAKSEMTSYRYLVRSTDQPRIKGYCNKIIRCGWVTPVLKVPHP